MPGIAAGISVHTRSLFALVFWRSRTLPRFAFVIIAERTERATLFAFVELGTTGIHFGIDPTITPLPRTTVCVCLTHTGALRSIEAATLALFAGIIEIAGFTHRHRIGGVAPREFAVAAFALVSATGNIACFIIGLLGHTLVLFEIDPRVTILAAATVIVGVALLLLRDVSRDGNVVIDGPLFIGATFAHLVVGRRIQIGEMRVTTTFAPIFRIDKSIFVV